MKMLLPGEKELADQLLKLTKTAREQEATMPEQCKILHEMGKLYLKDAIETGNGEQFVKSSALINAALVRTEDPNDQRTLQAVLCDIYKGITNNDESYNVIYSRVPQKTIEESLWSVTRLVDRIDKNKDILHALRVEIEKDCEILKHYFSVDTHTDMAYDILQSMKADLVGEALRLSHNVQTKMLEFFKWLWRQATEHLTEYAPCRYAVIGLGSLARQETTPYSDLECALLIETDTEENKQYFKNLAYLFQLLILDLGETPLPTVAIESLNDFLTPGGDKLYDIITPRGLRLDGAMPWACKTPIGRKETPMREALDLIKTPEEMAALLREDNVLGQAYKVADILCKNIIICGDKGIYWEYRTKCYLILSDVDNREKARRTMIEDYDRSPDWSIRRFSDYSLQSKQLYYRFPSTFVENLRLYFTPFNPGKSSWEVLDELHSTDVLSYDGASNLKLALAMSYILRLLTYLKNRGQYENFAFVKLEETPFERVRPKNPLLARSKCRVAYFGNDFIGQGLHWSCIGIRNVVKKHFKGSDHCKVEHLKQETFFEVGEEIDRYLWKRSKHVFSNLQWARASNELPWEGCGRSCGVNKIDHTMTEGLEEVLSIEECKCLSLIKPRLLASRILIRLRRNLMDDVSEEIKTFFLELLDSYRQKKFKNVRERFYLLIDVCSFAMDIGENPSLLVSITKLIEAFFDDIVTFEESQQKMANMMKYFLIDIVIRLYRMTEQFEKGLELCQQQIDKNDLELGTEGYHPRKTHWYHYMANIKYQLGSYSEALSCFQNAFDLMLNRELKTPITNSDQRISYRVVQNVRQMALTMVHLHRDHHIPGDAVDAITRSLILRGKPFYIESDTDIKAMCQLIGYCCTMEDQFEKGNQYFEELLEVVLEKGHTFKPNTVGDIILLTCFWIHRLGWSKCDFEPIFKYISFVDYTDIIGNVYKKHRKGIQSKQQTKIDFLIDMLCTLVSESVQKYYLEGKDVVDNRAPRLGVYDPEVLSSVEYFVFLGRAAHVGFNLVSLAPPVFGFGETILHQAAIFCEKVVKRLSSKYIHEMSMVYLGFQKVRFSIFRYIFTEQSEYLDHALDLASKVQDGLRQYFPHCQKALKATKIKELVHPLKVWHVKNIGRTVILA